MERFHGGDDVVCASFVRVLPPDKYDKIMELRAKQQGKKPMENMPGMEHPNHE